MLTVILPVILGMCAAIRSRKIVRPWWVRDKRDVLGADDGYAISLALNRLWLRCFGYDLHRTYRLNPFTAVWLEGGLVLDHHKGDTALKLQAFVFHILWCRAWTCIRGTNDFIDWTSYSFTKVSRSLQKEQGKCELEVRESIVALKMGCLSNFLLC